MRPIYLSHFWSDSSAGTGALSVCDEEVKITHVELITYPSVGLCYPGQHRHKDTTSTLNLVNNLVTHRAKGAHRRWFYIFDCFNLSRWKMLVSSVRATFISAVFGIVSEHHYSDRQSTLTLICVWWWEGGCIDMWFAKLKSNRDPDNMTDKQSKPCHIVTGFALTETSTTPGFSSFLPGNQGWTLRNEMHQNVNDW